MKSKIYCVIVWVIFAFVVFSMSSYLITKADSLLNVVGVTLFVVTILVSIETKLFTKFIGCKCECCNKEEREEEDQPESEDDEEITLSDVQEVEVTEEEESIVVSEPKKVTKKRKRSKSNSKKKKNEVQEQTTEA